MAVLPSHLALIQEVLLSILHLAATLQPLLQALSKEQVSTKCLEALNYAINHLTLSSLHWYCVFKSCLT